MKIFNKLFLVISLFGLSVVPAFAQNSGGVKGKVRDSDGDGLASVTVTARQNGEDVRSVRTDSKGKFELGGLKPGVYNFVFEKQGFATGVKYNVEIKNDKEVNLGDRLILTVDKGTQVIINGSVYNQAGFGIHGAKIEIEKISGGNAGKVSTGYTGEFGEFTFRFPDAKARYRVTATAKDATSSKEVEVDGAAIYRLAITLNLEK